MSAETSLVRHPSALRSIVTPTEEEVFLLFSELRDILVQYKKEVPGQRKPWPESITSRITKLWSLGVTSHQIASECELSAQTLYSMRQRLKKQKPGFSQVAIKRSKRRTHFELKQDLERHRYKPELSQIANIATTDQPSFITMTLPSGIKIEGILANQITDIIKNLGAI